ncbi:hypothetical protein QTL95_17765 [Rhizobium sp. S152]|uniref:DUF6894 family protein n=1 Tax=Rhizobium sp. S152 TaxID=3055038 RepID=UPI0025A9955D|nr:hypothetical protein [Rhizobium sp. S152]MDM9627745.1 hypothetical protein [Rhizobium sp. S152]
MRFYFDIKSEDGTDRDLDGIELPSLEAARHEARKAAREMIAEMVLENQRIDGMRFEILNECGQVLATIEFRELIH